MQDTQAIRLEVTQRNRAAGVLARAFQHDPLYVRAIPDEGMRAAVLSWLFDRVVHYCLLYGIVHTTPALDGVVCWLPPGQTHLSFGRVVRSGLYATPVKMGWVAYRRFDTYMRYADGLHSRHAHGPHWYLWAVGVDPPCQGREIGSRLLEPVLATASADGAACYLETGIERNVGFYDRHGFGVVEVGRAPGLGVPVWAMLRKGGGGDARHVGAPGAS
jgi:ribosomal protein S18 acetylase RimI-like enzyme